MLRGIPFLLIVILLAGCSHDPARRPVADRGCAVIADERAQDAADNGFGPATQRAIWNRVYDECLKYYNPVVVLSGKQQHNQ